MGEQLFFHASEVVTPDDFKGSKVAYFAQHFAAGDEVAFVVGIGQRGNVVGQQVGRLVTGWCARFVGFKLWQGLLFLLLMGEGTCKIICGLGASRRQCRSIAGQQ